jgi:hypothetical protein
VSKLRADHKALSTGRTIFLKTVKSPLEVSKILQPASTNSKLGAGKSTIMRGRWRGMKLFQLVLEERRTCPKSCQQWDNCYGNNMFLANRIDHRDSHFLTRLAKEIASHASKYPQGFVVRLHVLGDFYSKTYVNFWKKMLRRYPNLHVFGYTHRYPEHKDGIGAAILELNKLGAWIRFSDRGGEMSANVAPSTGPDDIQCPQEIGKTESCLTCGLCWQTTKPIKFIAH